MQQEDQSVEQKKGGGPSFMIGVNAQSMVSNSNIAGAILKMIKPEKKIIHRSMAGVIYEDTEDHIKKQKKKVEVSHTN